MESFFKVDQYNSEYKFLRNSNKRIEDKLLKICVMNTLERYNISNDVLKRLGSIIKIISNRPLTLIQNDLLPINIIKEKEKIKIIDWEHGAIGCYTTDIGRLLGDFQNDKGNYWVNNEWEEEILKVYYMEISKNDDFMVTYKEFLFDYECSKLINYVGIIFAFVINGWEVTDWYKLNYEKMICQLEYLKK